MNAKSYAKNAPVPVLTNSSSQQIARDFSPAEVFRFDLSAYHLLLMTLIMFSKNAKASYKIKNKVNEVLSLVPPDMYADNEDFLWRIFLARAVSNAVMNCNAKSLPAIQSRVMEDTEWSDYYASFFDIILNGEAFVVDGETLSGELSDEDVLYLDNYLSTRLRYKYIWQYKGFFRKLADRIDSDDLGEVSEFSDLAIERMENIIQEARRVKQLNQHESQDFDTDSRSFHAAIAETHKARNRPQSTVQTGVALFNEMTGGGYEGSRVYIHFARSGDGKSGWLANVAFWATDKRFNPKYETKDPTRKPAVLFVTMENDVFDTVERMVSFSMGSSMNLRGSDLEHVIGQMTNKFTSETCSFVFKYRASMSISTQDLEDMIEELYIDGFEVVMVVLDYIKRIRAVGNFRERHLELGAVVDQLSSSAKKYNIPFVTGMQLNRDAYMKIEAAIKSGKVDAVKELGVGNVSESLNVYENADVVIFQGRIYSKATDKLFLTMNRAKIRGKRVGNGTGFLAQPYEVEHDGTINEMRPCEDAHLPKRDWMGVYDVADGISKGYDPNNAVDMDDLEDERQTAGMRGGNGRSNLLDPQSDASMDAQQPSGTMNTAFGRKTVRAGAIINVAPQTQGVRAAPSSAVMTPEPENPAMVDLHEIDAALEGL